MNDTPARTAVPCVLASLTALALFGALAACIQGDNAVTRFDADVAKSVHEHTAASPTLLPLFQGITHLADAPALLVVSLVVVGLLLWQRRYGLAAAWPIAAIGGGLASEGIKNLFQRPRQEYAGSTPGWSFPSGHSMRAMVFYGLVAYVVVSMLPRRGARLAVLGVVVLVVLGVGFSRIYLSKHYVSDVSASFCFGAGWIAAWMAAFEVAGWRQSKTDDSSARNVTSQ